MDEGTIADLLSTDIVYVFLCNSTGTVLRTEKFDPAEITTSYKRIEEVPAQLAQVMVVAKIPAADELAVAALGSVDLIKAYAYTVASQTTNGRYGYNF